MFALSVIPTKKDRPGGFCSRAIYVLQRRRIGQVAPVAALSASQRGQRARGRPGDSRGRAIPKKRSSSSSRRAVVKVETGQAVPVIALSPNEDLANEENKLLRLRQGCSQAERAG